MSADAVDLFSPRILVVDDERQIHASLKLRLGRDYSLTCHTDARKALALLPAERFDLCIVDIHMPQMDGLAFVTAAQQSDPGLGYILLSAFDTDENLRRAIPLGVYDFIPKPLPTRSAFEDRLPGWIQQTRQRRHDQTLARETEHLASDLDSARLEREVELIASETARDALLQSATLLTTIHAHLVTATSFVAERAKATPNLQLLLRNLEEARRTADAAMSVTEGFFQSAYGCRDSSPALLGPGLRHATSIAMRMCHAGESNKMVDYGAGEDHHLIPGLSGIEFLLMLVPAMGAALTLASPETTVRITCDHVLRLDQVPKDSRFKQFLWVNRRNISGSHQGLLLSITASAGALSRADAASWFKGDYAPLARVTPRGLATGIQKSHALLGFAVAPDADQFRLLLVLPT